MNPEILKISMNYADFVLLGIIIVFALLGLKAGFVKMVFRVLSFFAAIILAKFLYPILSAYIKTTSMYGDIIQKITDKGAETGWLPSVLWLREGAVSVPAAYIAGITVNIISFVAVVIVVKLALIIAERLLRLFASLPVIGLVNRIAGLALGVCEGTLTVLILLALVSAFEPIRSSEAIDKAVTQPGITSMIYNNNPLIKITSDKQETKDATHTDIAQCVRNP